MLVEARAPRIAGLDRFVCDFVTYVEDEAVYPVHNVEEGSVDMTKLVTFCCHVKKSIYERIGISPEELCMRIYNYVRPALPSPRVMGVINFGFRVLLTDDDLNVLPDEQQPHLLPAPKPQLEDGDDAKRT